MTILVALLLSASAGAPQAFSIVMPPGLPDAPRSAAVVCRDPRGGWLTIAQWREVAGSSFAMPAVAAGNCRVLVRPAGTAAYLASNELPAGRSRGAIAINPQWLRNVDAPATEADVAWLGVGGDQGVECVSLGDRSRCWFVPLSSAGVLISGHPPQFRFSIVQAGEVSSAAPWQTAAWGRLIRARSPSGQVTAAVIKLHDVLRNGGGRLREARPAPGVTILRLGPEAFWLEGAAEPGVYLELRGERAATMRVQLAGMASPGAAVVDVALAHQEVITGDVRRNGAAVEGATVMLSRLLDTPQRVTDEERPRERIDEATTGHAGEFRFESLAGGKYELFIVHPTLGRAAAMVSPPAHTRLQLEPRAVIRGRVMRHGIPVPGALVQALPSIDAVSAARNPAALGSAAGRSDQAGRFEVIAPDEGRVVLSVAGDGAAFRAELGEAAALPQVTDVGEINLDDPVEVELLLELPAGCELRAAGPMGTAGLTAIRATRASPSRWILRPPHAGRWLVAGVCAGQEIALEPALITVPLARAGPILLKVRR